MTARDLPARARTVALAAALLLSVPALAACNNQTQTNAIYTPGEGVNNRDGRVDVLNALVVSDNKDGGRIIAGLSNNDMSEADELRGVTVAEGDAQVEVGDGDTEIPAAGNLQLADDEAALVTIKGVALGQFVRVTFEFANADAVTVNMPVVQAGDDYGDVEVPGQVTPSETMAEEPTHAEAEGH